MYTSSSFSKTAGALAALCALGGGVAFSAQSASSSAADRAFVQQAAKAGTEEVTEGKVESTSSDPNAAKFAKLMVRDHSKANAQLKIIAKNNGLTSALQQGVAAAKPAKTLPPQTYLRKEVPDHQRRSHYSGKSRRPARIRACAISPRARCRRCRCISNLRNAIPIQARAPAANRFYEQPLREVSKT